MCGNKLNSKQAPAGVKATVWCSVLVEPVFKAGIADSDCQRCGGMGCSRQAPLDTQGKDAEYRTEHARSGIANIKGQTSGMSLLNKAMPKSSACNRAGGAYTRQQEGGGMRTRAEDVVMERNCKRTVLSELGGEVFSSEHAA